MSRGFRASEIGGRVQKAYEPRALPDELLKVAQDVVRAHEQSNGKNTLFRKESARWLREAEAKFGVVTSSEDALSRASEYVSSKTGAFKGVSKSAGVATAYELADKAHQGQFRRDGVTPYIEHVKKVMDGVEGWEAKMVAALHDTVEDKRLSYKQLRQAGLPESVIKGVEAMTKPKGMPYIDYIKNVVIPNPLARKVKLADIRANMSDDPSDRALKKYGKALKLLVD